MALGKMKLKGGGVGCVVAESGGGGGCEIKDKNYFANLVPESTVL